YLTVSTSKDLDKDQKDENGKYIRQERYSGAMSRSFYVGNALTQEDVKAKYEDGILKLTLPKKAASQAVEAKKQIAIEG
ncbi:MAG TPA: Hsp20 family protein, partial [Candidatus Dorea gallistercoris]|nr:Hsp20 family protein [Candidatus Dorea gallistercoris]